MRVKSDNSFEVLAHSKPLCCLMSLLLFPLLPSGSSLHIMPGHSLYYMRMDLELSGRKITQRG